MKNTSTALLLLIFVGSLGLSSCVTKGKYLISEKERGRLSSDSANTHYALNACNSKVAALETDKTQLQKDKDALQGKYSKTSTDLKNTQSDLEMLNSSTKMTIEDQQRRLKNLQDLIQSQRDVMNKLKKTIADALVNFKADELSVNIKDGKVYVSLQEKLLFKSGSAVVDPKGQEALAQLAKVLTTTSDISVEIEGHTDSLPIKTAKFEDNWALSAGRATSIVRILTQDGFDPKRITASGKGEYHPLDTNTTPEGRTSNRRTEIILSPNLSELYKLLAQG